MVKPVWTHSGLGQIWVTRLYPGQDLKDEIENWVQEHGIMAGCVVSAVGSLSIAAIRFAGSSRQWNEGGDWELVSLQGTLGSEGVHLHISVADKEGQVFGGHLMQGSTIRTTMELVFMEFNNLNFCRVEDSQTGFKELKVVSE